jgi:hypothetical protein
MQSIVLHLFPAVPVQNPAVYCTAPQRYRDFHCVFVLREDLDKLKACSEAATFHAGGKLLLMNEGMKNE